MLESKLQAKCIKYAKDLGIYTVKIIRGNKAGIPDLLLCINGNFIAIEFKQPGKDLTELQKLNFRQIINSAGEVHRVDSFEDFETIIGVHKKDLKTELINKQRTNSNGTKCII